MMQGKLGVLFSIVLAAACAPAPNAVSAASIDGDATSCTTEVFCNGAACEGVARGFRCDQNGDTYDCVCVTDGEDGATFNLDDACAIDPEGDGIDTTIDFTIGVVTITETLNAECDAALIAPEG